MAMSERDGGGAPSPGEPPDRTAPQKREEAGAGAEPVEAAGSPPEAASVAAPVPDSAPAPRRAAAPGPLAEPPETVLEVAESRLRSQSRRDFLLFAAGVAA